VRTVVDIPLDRPRSPEVRRSPEFQALADQVWEIVREEIAEEFIQVRPDADG
jgi:hypothetical protein